MEQPFRAHQVEESMVMRRRIAMIPVVFVAALGSLAACATGSGTPSSPVTANPDYVSWRTFDVNGTPLLCAYYDRGISCDWVDYHLRNGDLARPSSTAKP